MDSTALRTLLTSLDEPDLTPDPSLAARLRRRHDRRRRAMPVAVAGLGVAAAAAVLPLVGRSRGSTPTSLAAPTADPTPRPRATLPPVPDEPLPADDLTRGLAPLPSAAYEESGDLARAIAFTIHALQNRCLVEAGLPPQPDPVPLDDVRGSRGSTSLSAAKADGYGQASFVPDPDETTPPDPLSAAQRKVLYGTDEEVGVSPSSCSGSITKRIYGVAEPTSTTLINGLNGSVYGAVQGDPRVADATRAWSACMHEAGFSYSDPGQALSAVGDSYAPGSTPVSAEREKRIAVADVTCKAETDLLRIQNTVQIELEKRYLGIYEAEAAQVRAELAHAKAFTDQVVDEELGGR